MDGEQLNVPVPSDYTEVLGSILSQLEVIRGCLELLSTLLFFGAVVMVAFGLVYMCYALLKKFML